MRGVTQLTAIGFTPRELCPPLHVLSAIVIALKTFYFPVYFSFGFFFLISNCPLFSRGYTNCRLYNNTTGKKEKQNVYREGESRPSALFNRSNKRCGNGEERASQSLIITLERSSELALNAVNVAQHLSSMSDDHQVDSLNSFLIFYTAVLNRFSFEQQKAIGRGFGEKKGYRPVNNPIRKRENVVQHKRQGNTFFFLFFFFLFVCF